MCPKSLEVINFQYGFNFLKINSYSSHHLLISVKSDLFPHCEDSSQNHKASFNLALGGSEGTSFFLQSDLSARKKLTHGMIFENPWLWD